MRASSRASFAVTTSLDVDEAGPVASDDGHEAAVFDGDYFPTGDGKAVFVDAVPDGLERSRTRPRSRSPSSASGATGGA